MLEWLATIKAFAGKFSVTGMLRERLALSEAHVAKLDSENSTLKAKVATLEAELNLIREAFAQEKSAHQQFKSEHEESIQFQDGIELRRGKRTMGKWIPFCPKCHIVLNPINDSQVIHCLADCGWFGNVTEWHVREHVSQLNQT